MSLTDRIAEARSRQNNEQSDYPRRTEWDVIDAPVEQLDDTDSTNEPARDFSSPASYDRFLNNQTSDIGVDSEFNVVDAPVDQLDEASSTPMFDHMIAELNSKRLTERLGALPSPAPEQPRGLSSAQAEALQEFALGTDVNAAHETALRMVARQERKEKRGEIYAKVRRKIGALAIASSEIVIGNALLASDKAGDLTMKGMDKVDTQMTYVGDKLNQKAADTRRTIQDKKFEARGKWDTFSTEREAKKAFKKAEKQMLIEGIKLDRRIIKDMKKARKDDRRFDRSMRNKERREKMSATWDMTKNTFKLGAESARESIDDKVDRTRKHNQIARRRARLAKVALRSNGANNA